MLSFNNFEILCLFVGVRYKTTEHKRDSTLALNIKPFDLPESFYAQCLVDKNPEVPFTIIITAPLISKTSDSV